MNAPINTTAAEQWDPEVLAFAREKGVEDRLEPLLNLTRRLFPNAKSINVSLEHDPDVPLRWIVFEVQVTDLSTDEAQKARRAWNEEALRIEGGIFTGSFSFLIDWVDP